MTGQRARRREASKRVQASLHVTEGGAVCLRLQPTKAAMPSGAALQHEQKLEAGELHLSSKTKSGYKGVAVHHRTGRFLATSPREALALGVLQG